MNGEGILCGKDGIVAQVSNLWLKYRVYEQQVNSKLVDLTVEHFSNVALTSSIGLRKLTIS